MLYTLVQHTAFSVNHDPLFKQAVEERSITPAQSAKIRDAGGVVFETLAEAVEAAEQYNYPPEVGGIIPHACGVFKKAGINEDVFIPREKWS